MPHLILLRHGQSTFNSHPRFCGWVNVPLTDLGIKQAADSAELLKQHPLTKDLPINLMVTSRLKRAVTTSQIILEKLDRLDMDIVKSWRLNERHYGKLQGSEKNEVLNKYGKEKYMFWRRAYDGCPPESDLNDFYYQDTIKLGKFDDDLKLNGLPRCESLKMVIERLMPFWVNNILKEIQSGKNIICVTHGSVVRSLLTILYNLSRDEVEGLNVPNGIPILIEFDENTWKPTNDKWVYLDPEKAKIEAEKVKQEGFKKLSQHI